MDDARGSIGSSFADFLDEQGIRADVEAQAKRALGLTIPQSEDQIARMALVVVKAAYDAEAEVWYVESSDLPGLNVEAPTMEELRKQVPLAVADLVEASGVAGDFDIPIEIIAHSSARARRLAA